MEWVPVYGVIRIAESRYECSARGSSLLVGVVDLLAEDVKSHVGFVYR